MLRPRAALVALALLCPGAGLAQGARPKAPPVVPPPVAAPEVAPPYEPQLMRLSEIMGSLAYLRDLCGDTDGDQWRQNMTALLDAEAASAARRERLAGAFNRGYTGYAVSYRACTPAAQVVIGRSLDEGGRLARELGSRFGGG